MVGSNRIVPANKIVNPLGNADLDCDEEKRLRRKILEKALSALETEVQEPRVFSDSIQV
jgi:glycine reductase